MACVLVQLGILHRVLRRHSRTHIAVHNDATSRTAALADDAAATGALVVADTREQVADLNQAIRERLVTAGQVDDYQVLVATRPNNYDLGVVNHDTWTVTGVRDNARQQWALTFARNRTDLGAAHAARLATQEAAKYEPYVEPHHLDNCDDPAPVSRRGPEPIPTFSRRPGAGPGIGF